ncbi:MAG: OmpA family protein [Planctomycetota bacterium]|nr:OmpA family protein [Planctomycetota bacterium]
MDRKLIHMVYALVLGGLALTLVGCKGSGLQEERDRLYTQNVEAQLTLDRTRAALEAAEADRANLSAEVTRLNGELDAAHVARPPAPVPVAAAGAGGAAPKPAGPANGFEGINGIETVQTAKTITLKIPGDVLFDSGKIALRPAALKTLDQIAGVIKKTYATKTVRVEGYADTTQIKRSSWDDNLELSLQRSAAVFRHLNKQGVNPVRMYAAGFGDWHPKKSLALSRRVEIVVVLAD